MSDLERLSPGRLALAPVVAVILLAMFLVGRSASAVTYTVIDLATLAQGSTVVVRGPNGASTAVGGGRVAGARRGLLFTRGGLQEISGLSGSDYTTIFGINDVGDVVGGSNTATAVRAFRSSQAGGTRELPPLADDTASTAFAVNKPGQAVGFSSGAGGEHAVLWAADGTVTALPGTSGAQTSRALGINEPGDVVGAWDTGSGLRAIVWPGGGAAQDLGTPPGQTTSEAVAVNARGDIVGYSADATGARRATLWQSRGGILNLGTLPGGDFSQALGINDAGDIVGTSTSSFGSRAFIWTSANGLQDLNGVIALSSFVLTQAVGINAAGVIVAIGRDAGDEAGIAGHEPHEFPVRVFLLLPSGVRP
jgi:probable HAF family extracellular repeat protein